MGTDTSGLGLCCSLGILVAGCVVASEPTVLIMFRSWGCMTIVRVRGVVC